MNEHSRSGEDRRQQQNPVPVESRTGQDQRSLLRNPDEIIERYRKISIFEGLTIEQFKKIIHICTKQKYSSQTAIYRMGEESKNMFILLKGKLNIMFQSGEVWHNITPTGTVGEMGIFTGEPRSATVTAETDCVVFNFSKDELFKLFHTDMDLNNKILMNVIKDLAKRLRKDNEKIEELYYRIFSLERL
ncbi:Crp/Fnr family transcriptional regulator [Candidatus Latescibacterota bacterium]